MLHVDTHPATSSGVIASLARVVLRAVSDTALSEYNETDKHKQVKSHVYVCGEHSCATCLSPLSLCFSAVISGAGIVRKSAPKRAMGTVQEES